MPRLRSLLALLGAAFAALALSAQPTPYDPLRLANTVVRTVELVARDAERGRDLPLLVYLPGADSVAAVLLFSHGLGGSRHGATYLGRHWAGRGYVVVFVQHPGSDEAIWRDAPAGQRLTALRRAASARNLVYRAGDISAVLDQLARWNDDRSHPLFRHLALSRVGMSGHSFGAVTTQVVGGATLPAVGARFTDRRIDAAIAMSPSVPARGDAATVFASVRIPWLLLTGTRDDAPIGQQEAASRLRVFPALPSGAKYEMVLWTAAHTAFTDRALPSDRASRDPAHHQRILAVSTAFWDAQLLGDTAARRWLDGDGARAVLDARDRWQHK